MMFSKKAFYLLLFIQCIVPTMASADSFESQSNDQTEHSIKLSDSIAPESTLDDMQQFLNKNACLFEGIQDRVFELLKLNKTIPTQFHKILVFINQNELERSLSAQAVAFATNRPTYTIDFKQRSILKKTFSLLGSPNNSPDGHHGELLNACLATNCVNPVIILKNIHAIAPEDLAELHEVLSNNGPVHDAYFDIQLPTQTMTFVATAQSPQSIPDELTKPYEARFILVETNELSRQSKQEIATRFFLPEVLKEHGLTKDQINNPDALIALIVDASQDAFMREGLIAIKSGLGKVILRSMLAAKANEAITELNPNEIIQLLRTHENIELPDHTAKIIKQKLADSPLNIHAYKNAIASFPWHKPEVAPFNTQACVTTLARKLSCIDALKSKALLFLNAYQQTPHMHKKALCIVGPCGAGKTAFANLIALAANRPFSSINLAHHPSLSGEPMISRDASPGEIFKAFCTTKTQAPTIILDNIDKSHQLNTITLSKILSPKQNANFLDFFADFTIDVSNTLFITTATDISALPEEILEHLECIYLNEYSQEDRAKIIMHELLPSALISREISEAGLREIFDVLPTLNAIVAPNAKGLHELARAVSLLVSQQLAFISATGKPLGLTPENLRTFLDPQLLAQHISEAKNVHAQCNEILKKLNLTPEQFKKIDSHITALKPWKGGDALTLLYIDWIQKYPFNKPLPQENVSLEHARAQLDATHFGLESIKENILDFLAGLQRRQISKDNSFTKTLCFAGGPGIGKTTFSKSIAASLGRPFARIALESIQTLKGGTGEHEMFGDGPGALGKAICEAGSQGAVILLDEIDKASPKVQCQLLEILDPAQNKTFRDSFLGLELDLSHVIFIASANDISNLPHPLHDRLHIIGMNPYSYAERVAIARNMIVPDIIREMNFSGDIPQFLNNLVEPLARTSLRLEYGVRSLKRILYLAADKYARMLLENLPITELSASHILADLHPELLQNNPIYLPANEPQIGITNGMYAGGISGGGTMKIEVAVIPFGDGKLVKSLLLGNTAQESQLRSLTFVKMNAEKYGINHALFKTCDFYFSSQSYESANGPSAGIAQTVALISALTKRAVRPGWAITGTLDTYGTLLPVGGYRAKILGTAATGIKNFVVPECARPTIEALSKDFVGLSINFANTIDDALDLLLDPAQPNPVLEI